MNILSLRPGEPFSCKLTVTSYHPGPVGGGLLIGTDECGVSRRAAAADHLMPRPAIKGEVWRISGRQKFSERHNSAYIEAEVALPMPIEGEAIIRYLADSPSFPGVGIATAQRLRNGLGLDGLYAAIREKDYERLSSVVDPTIAVTIVNAADLLHEEIATLSDLDKAGIDARTAGLAFSIWGRDAASKLEAQPYSLRLVLPWRQVDQRALRLGVHATDERRLLALVEEAFAARFRAGHTACTKEELSASFRRYAGNAASAAAPQAIESAIERSTIIVHSNGLLQSRAAWWMEREVERLLLDRLSPSPSTKCSLAAEIAVAEVTATNRFPLNEQQVNAVHMVMSSRVSALAGGAGTGKTTTLQAIIRAVGHRLRLQGHSVHAADNCVQVAVAGRAARRITQATGAPAMTLARLIQELEGGLRNMSGGVVIADETSMFDLVQLYRLLTLLPDDTDLLFSGDPSQLPSIGPGQVFRSMLEGKRIPRVVLHQVHRQDEATGIPAIAAAIREGMVPDLPLFDPSNPMADGVFIAPTDGLRGGVAKATFSTFASIAGPVPVRGAASKLHAKDVQVLCPTKNGLVGTKELNRQIEDVYMSRQLRAERWGLSVGSKVLWLKNDYRKAPLRNDDGSIKVHPRTGVPIYAGLMNGSLGVVARHSNSISIEENKPGSWVDFDDGTGDWIYESDLQNLTHGWAITVHKAQGSAFERVVLPVSRNRLLDRSMVYTAVTRAVQTCVLVGDISFLRQTVAAEPRAFGRRTCLSL